MRETSIKLEAADTVGAALKRGVRLEETVAGVWLAEAVALELRDTRKEEDEDGPGVARALPEIELVPPTGTTTTVGEAPAAVVVLKLTSGAVTVYVE